MQIPVRRKDASTEKYAALDIDSCIFYHIECQTLNSCSWNSDADKDCIVPTKTSKKPSSAKTKTVATKKTVVKKAKPASAKSSSGKKTATAKKPAVKKAAAAKPPVKKAAAKKAPAKKVAAKKTTAVSKATAKKPSPSNLNGRTLNGQRPEPKVAKAVKGKPLTKRELKKYEKILMELRERLQGDIRFLTTDNLHRAGRETGADLSGSAQHSADHGTDNFDREFALSLASTEQDVLYEVDEALMRIYEGEYGICAMTGVQIERARLEVIPYTRYSVQAQSKMEQSRAKYRPFAQTFKGW